MSEYAEPTETLRESEVFHILGNDRRREIVSVLAEREDRVDVSDVATEVASRESEAGDSVPNNLYKSVYVSLQQTHLPQLEADGVIEYDTEEKTIAPGPHFDEIEGYIATADPPNGTLLQITFGTAILGLVLVALSGAELPVFGMLSPASWGAMSLLAVALCSLIGLRSDGTDGPL